MTEKAVRTRLWRNGVLEKDDFPFEDISEYLQQPEYLVWVDLQAPDAQQLDALAEELSLDPIAVESALAYAERPKASRFATHTFVTAYSLHLDKQTHELQMVQISAFIRKNALVTVHMDDLPDLDGIVERWDDNADLCVHGVRSLVYGMLDYLVDQHFAVIQDLDDEIEELEDVLFDDKGRPQLVQRRTYALRKSLVQARRVILPMREVVNALLRHNDGTENSGNDSAGSDALRPYLDDLYDHVLRAAEWTESLRDMVSSVFETNLSLQDARLNTIMKKLTSWAAIIAVPTAVTGFYGQNVPYPGFGKEWGFVISVLVMIGIAGGLYVTFRRRDWL